jgi:hypothetical protein
MLLRSACAIKALATGAASVSSSVLPPMLAAIAETGSMSGCRAPAVSALTATSAASGRRFLHVSARSNQMGGFGGDEGGAPDPEAAAAAGADDDEEGGGGGGGGLRERRGRPFLDPRAPRRQESVRNNPKSAQWGGMMDIMEHSIYCNGQREEDADGFFFDYTVPEYDSDCDGDPFSNGYLTEDEMEFDEDYQPDPYIPAKVATNIYFLYTARGYTIKQLSVRYRLSSERVCAMIMVKHREPEMIATGRINRDIDAVLIKLYGTKFAPENRFEPSENWRPDFDQGVQATFLADDQMPDDVMPIRRTVGSVLRNRHHFKKVTPPRKDARVHDSKFVFKNISGRVKDKTRPRPMIISDFDGRVRPASNMESLYRSWETRYWTLDEAKGRTGLPFKEEDAHKPADYRLVP